MKKLTVMQTKHPVGFGRASTVELECVEFSQGKAKGKVILADADGCINVYKDRDEVVECLKPSGAVIIVEANKQKKSLPAQVIGAKSAYEYLDGACVSLNSTVTSLYQAEQTAGIDLELLIRYLRWQADGIEREIHQMQKQMKVQRRVN